MEEVRSDTPRFSIRGLLIFTLVIAVIAAVVAGAQQMSTRRRAEIARLAEQSNRTKVRIVQRIETIRAQLGRVPRDQAEIEELLGEPMPVVYEDDHPLPIIYQRTGNGAYQLIYTSFWTDDWIYDSKSPQAGWVQHYY